MGNISVDYDVLNQKGSPAWYSDIFANIPTPGYKGRMFISTDTFAFYRDNGTGWDLTGGPGTGTITGAGVIGQLTYFIGTDVISGNNNLFYDITNGRLGINTATPGSPLDIHSSGTAAQFNGTTTNNAFVFFQNAGTSKWRIGNLYNSGANDYQIYDVLNATARLTIKNTGATTLTGTFTATSLIKSGGTSSQILLADGTTTPTSTFGTGSVTNVSALTLGTTGTDLTSSVVNSTTTPVITLNVPTANATNRGALSSADWTTFNNKQATLSLTTTGTSGAATLVGATLNIPNYTNVGTVTSVAALTLGTTGTDLSSSVANSTSTPVITLNVPTASASNRGALSTTDWTTFNNKQGTISVTAPVVLTGATISMPAATTSVSGYLTSTDWNTFNSKTSNLGTVTDVVALTIGTTGIDITSTAVTTTTTPVITLNIPTASASNRGALSSTDWTTFNNKQATLSLTTTGTSGAATLVANTLNVPNYGSALSGYLPLTGGTLTGPLNGTTATFSGSSTFGQSSTSASITTKSATGTAAWLMQDGSAANKFETGHYLNNYYIYSYTNSTTALTLTGTGNLGLGVTPSAWSIVTPIMQIGTGGGFIGGQGSANVIRVGVNTYFSGTNWTYINADYASWFETGSGAFKWYNAPSGTAGGIVTTTQAMTLTASGRLLIGTPTEASYMLDVNGTGRFSSNLTATNYIEIIGDLRFNSSGSDRSIYFRGTAGSADGNWKMGNYLTPTGATVVTAAATVIDVYGGGGSTYGFMVRNTLNSPLLQIAGDTGAATFSSSVTASGGFFQGNGSFTNNGFWGTLLTTGTGSYADFAIIDNTSTQIMRVPTGTRDVVFSSTLGINGTSNNVRSGTYTPTVTAGTNCAAVTAYPCQYMQVDKVVTVSGQVYGSATAVTTETQFTMSVPVGSNFTQVYQCGGTGRSAQGGVGPSGAGYVASIAAVSTDTVRFSYTAPAVLGTGGYFWFSFTYQII